MEVARGRFNDRPAGTDVTKLETTMSFLQIKDSVGLHEKIRQVRHEICQNRRETAQVRLEAIAGTDNPYSLLQVFGRGHVIAKNGAVTYVTRCNPVEVLPRVSNNCTEEIPVTWNDTSSCSLIVIYLCVIRLFIRLIVVLFLILNRAQVFRFPLPVDYHHHQLCQ
jgi:hypothetical protein